jgi:hypothetical protein
VKVRGTAAHIAEKYGVLARDAQSAGDRIAAESYFQHAEHYNRIVAAAQAQTVQQTQNREASDEDGSEDERQDSRTAEARDESGQGGDGQGAAARDDRSPSDDDDEAPRKRRRPRRQDARPANPDQAEAASSGAADDGDGADSKEAAEPPKRRSRKTNGHDAPVTAEAADQPPVNGTAEPEQPASQPAGEADEADATKDGSAALAAFPD